ncbi:MAG: type III pantothenate kinase [Clostridia bacterium]|nr:type III pantothenate kinase [Clostridia bacterium]
MLFCVDIGNSNIKFGVFSGDDLAFVSTISTDTGATEDEYAIRIKSALALHSVDLSKIDGAIISSVVPQITCVISRAIEFLFGVKPLVVGPGVKSGIGIQCDMPSSVGADLICASVAADAFYGRPAIIVDMGTATKLTVINNKGSFIGTSIAPGVMLGLNALARGTAQLPLVGLEAPPSVIGKNTADCMKSGIIFGNAAMLDGMIRRIKDELREDAVVVATGGYASTVIAHCREKIIYDADLILKGLNCIYKKNK